MAGAEATASSSVALGVDSLVGSEGVRALGQTLGDACVGMDVCMWLHGCMPVFIIHVCVSVCFCVSFSVCDACTPRTHIEQTQTPSLMVTSYQ